MYQTKKCILNACKWLLNLWKHINQENFFDNFEKSIKWILFDGFALSSVCMFVGIRMYMYILEFIYDINAEFGFDPITDSNSHHAFKLDKLNAVEFGWFHLSSHIAVRQRSTNFYQFVWEIFPNGQFRSGQCRSLIGERKRDLVLCDVRENANKRRIKNFALMCAQKCLSHFLSLSI